MRDDSFTGWLEAAVVKLPKEGRLQAFFANIEYRLQAFASVCKRLQAFAKLLQAFASVCKRLQAFASVKGKSKTAQEPSV